MTLTDETTHVLHLAVDAALGRGAEDLVALDVSEPMPFADVFLVATGRSERNVAAIADAVEEKLLDAGRKRVRREGRAESRWVLLDFDDFVVHVFHEQEREYYGLERLWKDCPVVPLPQSEPAGTADER